MPEPVGLIFDFDGVIMDSEPVHERTLRAAAESIGLRLSHEDFIRDCVGTADFECLRRVARQQGRDLQESELDSIVVLKRELFARARAAGEIRPITGTIQLMHQAAAHPQVQALGVCTGSRRVEAELQLRAAGVWELLGGCITRENVARIKPDPEPYLRACECLDLPPARCIALEDTIPGLQSALQAGLRVAAVCHTLPGDDLAQAHRVFDSTAAMNVDDLLRI